jgi:hypothetical protein
MPRAGVINRLEFIGARIVLGRCDVRPQAWACRMKVYFCSDIEYVAEFDDHSLAGSTPTRVLGRRAFGAHLKRTRYAARLVKLRCYARSLNLKVQLVCSFIALPYCHPRLLHIMKAIDGELTLICNARNCFDAAPCMNRSVRRAANCSNF